MTSENAASGPPWPIDALPWPSITYLNGYSPRLEINDLVPVWAVGPSDGPVTYIGSAAPRLRFRRLAKASSEPLSVHDVRWCQGHKGHRLARALRKIVSAPIAPSEYRILVEVEAARLGITLADHVAAVRAIEADAQAKADAVLMSCYPGKSIAEVKASFESTPEEREAADTEYRDLRTRRAYEAWEDTYRRTPGVRPRRLFQRNRSIVKAYKGGATLADIGSDHGISFGRVRRILDDMGVDRRPKGGFFARRDNAA